MPVKFIRVFFAILVASSLQAQTSSHTWAHLIRDLAFGRAVAVDANGNSYFTGYYYQTVKIGSTVLTNKGTADIYLAKFDATGNPFWARSAGGSGYDVPSRNAVDASGNCYLTGSFNGSAAFGSRTVSSAGATDGFVAKYDTAGECAWVVAIGGRYADEVRGVTTDARGNCYVTGTFGDAFILSNGQLISSSGGTDFFIVKISPAGTILWAAQGGGSGDDAGVGVTVDARGAVYVTGNFTASMRIGSTVLTPNGTDNTASDMFIAKYDSMGTPLWAHQSKGRAYVRGISTDASGNSTVT
ncbi:MAG TPA: hypothetical protein VK470_16865, partial [Bacteroidota bacterium]|nr:hypothetical protein [Bacteroidota bacterium]